MKKYIFDIETDGLIDEVTTIYCLSYTDGENVYTLYTKEEIVLFFEQEAIFIGHNIIMYDFPVLKKIYGIEIPKDIIDTLLVCWYLYPKLITPGLKFWGNYFKVPKVEVEDWKSGDMKLMKERCERDVLINKLLWIKQSSSLKAIYGNYMPLTDNLSFKGNCIRIQEENPIKLDIENIKKNIEELSELFKEKTNRLKSLLPSLVVYGSKTFKKCICTGQEYLTKSQDPALYKEMIERGAKVIDKITIPYIRKMEEPNGNSVDQIKAYLFSLGWKPSWYKKSVKKDGSISEVPQIGKENGKSGELCPSIIELFEIQPELEALESKGVLQHRLGVLKGFLKAQKNGYLAGSIKGFTNTLRVKHSGIVNLVGHPKPYWEYIRGSFICEDDEIIIGADLSGLESSTQHHYMYEHDPEYVNKIRVKGYDPHLELGVLGGMISLEEAEHYKKGIEDDLYFRINSKRQISKTCNFALTYGAFPPKVAATAKIKVKEATALFDSYWLMNKSIIDATKTFKTKKVEGHLWVLNPISKLWYHVKSEKDIFNTVNQSSGAWVFDSWLKILIKNGIVIRMQYHDEFLTVVKKDKEEETIQIIKDSIDELNEKIKLNVRIECKIKSGKRYSDTH